MNNYNAKKWQVIIGGGFRIDKDYLKSPIKFNSKMGNRRWVISLKQHLNNNLRNEQL